VPHEDIREDMGGDEMNELQEAWHRAWQAIGAEPAPGLLDRLINAYGEPQRHYHTLQHLQECLGHLERVWHVAERPGEVALALWFHDAVYDVQAHDNEAQSAAWARRELRASGAADDVAERVEQLIMATCHAALPQGMDACLLVDIDLAILGASPERFAEYEAQVQREYSWVPPEMFRVRREQILREFDARQPIYQTPPLQQAWEAQAHANLQQSIRQLNMPTIDIRPYETADREAALLCFRSNVPAFFSAEDEAWFVSALDEPDGPSFVVVAGGEVVGFGGYEVSDSYNHAVLVFGQVHADWHSQGLGSRLLQHRIEHLKRHGPPTKYLIVDTTLKVAPFYVQHGFEIVSHWREGFRDGADKVDLRLVLL
jgi:predicted metal-dependent HD superfamily phosphohydrolase/GNAT superfamily N-acetyltransferase